MGGENNKNGRQRWCTRMVLGGGFSSALFDGFDNLYIGQPGLMISYPPTQWVRWRTNVIGMPTNARFPAAGQLLVATHLGQVLILSSIPIRCRRPKWRVTYAGVTDD